MHSETASAAYAVGLCLAAASMKARGCTWNTEL